jgi:DNA-directed RNA polymerase specialized sigma24 family protein
VEADEKGMNSKDDFDSDAELCEALRRKDPRAEEAFYAQFAPVIVRRIRRDLGGHDLADGGAEAHAAEAKLLSQVIYKVARQLREKGVSNLTSYVLTATDRAIRDWADERKRAPELVGLEKWDEHIDPVAPSEPELEGGDEVDGLVLRGSPRTAALFREAFSRLSDRQQRVLLLRYRDFAFSDINRMTAEPGKNISDAAVARQFTRAEDKLAEICLELADCDAELKKAIRAERARRKARRKKSTRKIKTTKEGIA